VSDAETNAEDDGTSGACSRSVDASAAAKIRRLADKERARWRVSFFVPGDPQAKGDRTVGIGKNGHTFNRERDAGKKANWRAHAAEQARSARGAWAPYECAVRVHLEVLRIRPKSHYGTGKNAHVLKASAPPLPTSAPDLDKLQRSLGDALNGVMWRDDALISTWVVTRRWAAEAGIRVLVEPDSAQQLVAFLSINWAQEAG
jgi:Holliday junction resolvase RusA-like endonuclease